MKRWSASEIEEQQERVNASKPNRFYYERGRLDCMLGTVVRPVCSTTEGFQWETGWSDEYKGVERPYEIS